MVSYPKAYRKEVSLNYSYQLVHSRLFSYVYEAYGLLIGY